MANREAGEVEFEGKDGHKYLLRLDVNAMIAAQAELGIKDDLEFWDLIGRKLAFSLPTLRALMVHGLRGEDARISVSQVGRLITELTTHGTAAIVLQALTYALPPEPEKKEAAATEKAAGEEPRPSDGPTST